MNKKELKDCIRKLHNGKDVEENLGLYRDVSMGMYGNYARVKLMLEYYIYYEMISEGINPYIDSAKESTDQFNQILYTLMEESPSKEELESLQSGLLKLRNEVMDKMQVLTAYVDCFVVYEYILNRIEYRFEDMEMLPEDNAFLQDVVNFIFGSKDNVAINDNIHFVIGQLPMRMTRNHYFDIVKDSMTVYKGGDKSAFDSFLYMFRTNAMLYKTEHMDEYFTEFAPVLDELASLDYENMTKEMYQVYAEKIRLNASKLNDVSDLYMQLGQLINEAYILSLTASYPLAEEIPSADIVIRGINSLFLERETSVWEGVTEAKDEESRLYWLGEHFPGIEGKQENLYEGLNQIESVLDEILEVYPEQLKTEQMEKDFLALKQMASLNTTSVFVELEEKQTEEVVTEEMIEKEAEKLVQELKALFQSGSRMLRRAVMANTLEKLPVFFQTPQEVADYITTSLAQCDDEAEKYAAKQLIIEMMQS